MASSVPKRLMKQRKGLGMLTLEFVFHGHCFNDTKEGINADHQSLFFTVNVFLSLRMAAAKFIKTEKLRNELLVVESNGQPEHFYLYQKQKHKGNTDYYQCRECFAQKRRRGQNEVRVPLIGVRDGTLTKEDTDGGHCENCRPCTNEYVVALSQKRNMYENMETGRKRAFQAHAEMLDNLPERCREEGASYAETITQLPGYHQMSVSMWRHRKKGLPPIEDWTNLPHNYTVSYT